MEFILKPEPVAQSGDEPVGASVVEMGLVPQALNPTVVEFVEDPPFRIDDELGNLWGDADSYRDLLISLEKNGFDDVVLFAGKVAGDSRKPLLYDGHKIWRAREHIISLGRQVPLPDVRIQEFASEEDIWEAAYWVQARRRNMSRAELALAAIKLEARRSGITIAALSSGRPSNASSSLMSAKKAAVKYGLSENSMTIVTRAQKHPAILEQLFHRDPDKRIPITRAGNLLKAIKRDQVRKVRADVLKKRQTQISEMPAVATPGVVRPDGIYTGDLKCVMPKIAEGTASLILCSPPYPLRSVAYDTYCFTNYRDYLDDLIRPMFAEAKRVLRPGGRIVVNFDSGPGFSDESAGESPHARLPVIKDYSLIAENENGLQLLDHKSWGLRKLTGA